MKYCVEVNLKNIVILERDKGETAATEVGAAQHPGEETAVCPM